MESGLHCLSARQAPDTGRSLHFVRKIYQQLGLTIPFWAIDLYAPASGWLSLRFEFGVLQAVLLFHTAFVIVFTY